MNVILKYNKGNEEENAIYSDDSEVIFINQPLNDFLAIFHVVKRDLECRTYQEGMGNAPILSLPNFNSV